MPIDNRITKLLGVEFPIIQAPMGWIARSKLASAVSNAGGLGIIETSSGDLEAVRAEIHLMRELTDRPFGVNIAQAFVRDPDIVSFVVDQGVKFVSTSAGDPNKYCSQLKSAGLTVFHVVPSLQAALRAVEAGVDGLIVEGGEGGGFKNPRDVATMVLLPWSARKLAFRSLRPEASSTDEQWQRPSPSARKPYRWAPGWCRQRNRPYTPTGNRRFSRQRKLTRCS